MHSLTNQYKFSDLNEYLIDKKKKDILSLTW